MANESVTVTQSLDQVTVVSDGPIGLNAGGTILGALNVGVDGTGHDVKFFGDTAGKYMQWDQSADKLFINGEFEVNGTATTFNSTVITIDDPIFSLGGQQRTDALDDSKDRGIEFFYHDGAQKTGFMGYDDSEDAFTFLTSATNSNEIFSGTAAKLITGAITASGNVGIGTATPQEQLHLYGASAAKMEIESAGGGDASLKFQVAAQAWSAGIDNGDGDKFKINTGSNPGSAEMLAIDSSGNVGIGTTSPAHLLHVYSSGNGEIEVERASGAAILTQAQASLGRFGTSSNHNLQLMANNSGYVTVTTAGNVGIGTTAPSFTSGGGLQITHSSQANVRLSDSSDASYNTDVAMSNDDFYLVNRSSTGDLKFRVNSSTEAITVIPSGNVGIGTTSPSYKLHVDGTANIEGGALSFSGTSSGSASDRYISSAGTSDGMFFNVPTNGDFYFAENNSTGFRLDFSNNKAYFSGLNIGIGTTAPAKTLDVDGDVRVLDGHKFFCGDGDDLEIYHDSTDSRIDNSTGNLMITNYANDKDIIFKSDDGSGGIETYFFLDGSANGGSNPYTIFPDNSILAIGDSKDLLIWHNATNSYVQNFVGDLHIENYADDKDILFRCDDGSGGLETYFFLDGSASSGNPLTQFPDLSQLAFGDSQDLLIRHDGTDSIIQNNGGDFIITQHTNDKDLIFKCDDGSGGVETYFFLDGSASGGYPYTVFPDNSYLAFGSGNDLQIRHSGTKTEVYNYVGDLEFINYADDKDIIFKSDAGSGAVETYFFLDGSASSGNPYTVFPDNSLLAFGSGRDFIINHNGTNANLGNYTGDIEIVNYANDKDIIFKTDDGSGGTAEYFRLDGSAAGSGNLFTIFPDSSYIGLGSNGTGDFIMAHNGTNTTFANYTGDLQFTNNTDDGDMIFRCDDGSGGVETYFFLDGSTGYTQFPDNKRLALGSSDDFQIFHDALDSTIQNSTGHLYVTNFADDKDIIFQSDDGSGGVTPYFTLDGSVGYSVASKHVRFEDNIEARFGAGSDFRIYHDGNNNFVDGYNGHVYIRNTVDNHDIVLQTDDGSGGITEYFRVDGGTEQVVFSKALNYSTTLVNDSNYTTTRSDSVILFHSMSTYRYLTLASADCVAGRKIHVKNRDNSEYIYIQTEGSENIDGSSMIIGTQTARGSITLIADGSNWFILNKYST